MRLDRHFAFAIPLLLAAGRAHAVCLPVQHYVYVGNDAQCNATDIQTAIESAVCPGTNIVLTSELTYSGQAITVDKAVNIVGSTATCNAPPVVCDPSTGCGSGGPPPKIGVGGDGMHPVFYVTSSGAVGFRNLAIGGGVGASNSLSGSGGIGIFGNATQVTLSNVELLSNAGGYGAGVAFYGDGSLTLDGVSIHDNQSSGSGGGLSAVSSFAGHIDVTIANDPYLFTGIYKNSSSDMGGGIYVDGNVHLLAVSSNAQILNNQAGQEGGGVAAGGGAVADIGMAGNAIDGNTSNLFGGGIAVIPDSSGNAVVRLFDIVASQPLTIIDNTAAQWGGGLYVYPGAAAQHATACLFDVALTGNRTQYEGAAIKVGAYGRLLVDPASDSECDPAAVAALGAVPAVYGTTLFGNAGVDSGNHYTDAAAIDIDGNGAQVQAQRLHLEQNGGGYAIRAQNAAGASLAFSQCLLDENYALNELVNLHGAAAGFDGCTFAINNINGGAVFAFDSGLSLTRSIVAEASGLDVWNPGAASGLAAEYLMLSGPKLPTDNTVTYADPVFVGPGTGDFHLQITSPAVDYAPTGNETGSTSLDGFPREADLPNVANRFGARDLGAYEVPLPDEIFKNGFELPL